ncbi:MAG: arylsulfatase [Gammaproteobacteria bacterium]|nr:arylsulfatase [Gammaproteobacteria bacterium]
MRTFGWMMLVSILAAQIACSDGRNSAPSATPDAPAPTTAAPGRPNILVIVADDLGITDLGAFGGEIATPNLDALADAGLMLTGFHTAPTCSPTRSMLLTGTDNHVAGVGAMAEYLEIEAPENLGQPGYEGYLNDSVVPLAELLQDAGYRTYMTGKWHLGQDDAHSPASKGFDRSYALLNGGAGHFTSMGLFESEATARFREDGVLVELPENFYSTRFYAQRMIEYIGEPRAAGQPFFGYLAFTAPHWPLQAPADSIARQHGRYDDGYEALYYRRVDRLKSLGLIAQDMDASAYAPTRPAWSSLSEEQKAASARTMEIYAAMVADLDHYVGEVISALKANNEYDNTLILFMSDNGAQGNLYYPGVQEWMAQCCDNSYENLGKPDSYVLYGDVWARVSSGISKLFKGFTTEGGIHTPAIISFPAAGMAPGRYDEFLSVMDVMPTLLEMAATTHPGEQYKGHSVVPLQGKSFAKLLRGDRSSVHGTAFRVGWELHGNRALREGDWKVVLTTPPAGSGQWSLYNLRDDPMELTDLAKAEPERLAALVAAWNDYARDNGVITETGDSAH